MTGLNWERANRHERFQREKRLRLDSQAAAKAASRGAPKRPTNRFGGPCSVCGKGVGANFGWRVQRGVGDDAHWVTVHRQCWVGKL